MSNRSGEETVFVIFGDRLGDGELALGIGARMVVAWWAEWHGHEVPKRQLNCPAGFPTLLDE